MSLSACSSGTQTSSASPPAAVRPGHLRSARGRCFQAVVRSGLLALFRDVDRQQHRVALLAVVA